MRLKVLSSLPVDRMLTVFRHRPKRRVADRYPDRHCCNPQIDPHQSEDEEGPKTGCSPFRSFRSCGHSTRVGGGKELARVLRSCTNSAAESQQQNLIPPNSNHTPGVQYRLKPKEPQPNPGRYQRSRQIAVSFRSDKIPRLSRPIVPTKVAKTRPFGSIPIFALTASLR